MITQTIKHWLNKLFAWRPWRRTATTAYAPPSRDGAISIPQEHLCSASSEGSLPQTGARYAVIEQSQDSATPETTLPLRPPSVEHIDMVPPLRDIPFPPRLAQEEKIQENLPPSGENIGNPEQQLAFLHYLVSHGLINEGFEEGKVPEQYRKKE